MLVAEGSAASPARCCARTHPTPHPVATGAWGEDAAARHSGATVSTPSSCSAPPPPLAAAAAAATACGGARSSARSSTVSVPVPCASASNRPFSSLSSSATRVQVSRLM